MKVTRAAFVVVLTFGVFVEPLVAGAQPAGKVWRIGVLGTGVNPRSAPFYAAFEQRLRDLGYVEGQSITIDFRLPSAGQNISEVAANLVQRNLDVLLPTCLICSAAPPITWIRSSRARIPPICPSSNPPSSSW